MRDIRFASKGRYLALALFFLSVGAVYPLAAQESSFVPMASVTSGPAPLYVHFIAGRPDGEMDAAGFHENDYSWDFGDPASGSWGLTQRDKNTAKGAVAAHVFESPGTYTVSLRVLDGAGKAQSANLTVTVTSAESAYGGMRTICVSDTDDFDGAPMDARWISTSDLRNVARLAVPGTRILFRRGGTWTTEGLDWPNGAGPVTIGAFGPAEGIDELGIAKNAPVIVLGSGNFLPLDYKQNWTVMDLHFRSDRAGDGGETGVFGGAMDFRRMLFLRLKIEGFGVAIGWAFWNVKSLAQIDQMAVVSCDLRDAQSNVMYVGGERLALLGNRLADARDSHVLRVWQAWRSVISDNVITGSSLSNEAGRHALKLHGPGEGELGPRENSGKLARRTGFTIVSDNVFGGSGPWPVNIAPQNGASDERISDIVFERNLYRATLGSLNATPVQVALRISARNVTVRNNILDGSGWGKYFTGIVIERTGSEPVPDNLRIFNNTIVKSGNNFSEKWIGVSIAETVKSARVSNNLVFFPDALGPVVAVQRASSPEFGSQNVLLRSSAFQSPYAQNNAYRGVSLNSIASVKDAGVPVLVYDDYYGNARMDGKPDVGSYEQSAKK